MCGEKRTQIERRSRPGLCRDCRTRLSDQLARLPNLYRWCEGMLVNTRGADVGRIRGGLPAGISLNAAAVAVRTEMMTVLASWAGLVVDELRIRPAPGRDVRALADFLGGHVDWLAVHPAAADAAGEIAALVRSAEDMISPDAPSRVELGPCARAGCGSVVSLVVEKRGDQAQKMIKCDDGHVWPPQQWLVLRYKIEQVRGGPRSTGSERVNEREERGPASTAVTNKRRFG
jgi:hypothetical protein